MIGQRDPLDHPAELVRRIYAFVAYRLGDGPDAEDVTSETFLRALRYRDSYQLERGEPIAWLIGIARRAIVEHVGRGVENSESQPVAGKHIEQEETWVRILDLRRAVGVLEPRDRELIALRYGADLTARQIGELLDMRPNAVEVALSRAVARLRVLLEREAVRPAPHSEQARSEGRL